MEQLKDMLPRVTGEENRTKPEVSNASLLASYRRGTITVDSRRGMRGVYEDDVDVCYRTGLNREDSRSSWGW